MISRLYLNTPSCPKLCDFCNFFKTSLKAFDSHFPNDHFAQLLIKELILYRDHLSKKLFSFYTGGGSPIEIRNEAILPFFEYLHQHFDCEDTEKSIEANPILFSNEDKKALHSFFNRISIGIQSFTEKSLETINRPYTIDEHYLARLRDLYKNLNFDLIQDIYQGNATEDIKRALKYHPEHLSVYSLEYDQLDKVKKVEKPSPLEAEEEFLDIRKTLAEHAYSNYEISNFSLLNKKSKHNQAYWNGENYIGLGPGAVGTFDLDGEKVRYTNETHLPTYIKKVNQGKKPWKNQETLNQTTQHNEFIMLSLRQKSGIHLQTYIERFGINQLTQFEQIAQKYQDLITMDEEYIAFSIKGWLYFDHLCPDFFI